MPDPAQNISRTSCGFAALLYRIVMHESRGSARDLADRAGMSYDMLYSRMTGRVPIKPDEVRRLIAALGDQRLAQWLMADSHFVIAQRPNPEIGRKEMAESVAAVVRETVDIWRNLALFTDYRQLGPKARADLLAEVHEAEIAIANLRVQLE